MYQIVNFLYLSLIVYLKIYFILFIYTKDFCIVIVFVR